MPRKGSRSAPRRNWAQIVVGVVVAVLPFIVSAIGKVLGYSVSAFNALPRAERREKLRGLLSSKAWLATLNPMTVAMARQAAKSPAAIEVVLDLLEDHGAQAVSAGTAAATVAVKAASAKRAPAASAPVVPKTNGRRARRNGWTIDRPFYPWAEKEAQYAGYTDAELHYARLDARKARDVMEQNARELERSGAGHGAVEQARQAAGWYADDVSTILSELHKRHGSHPRRNGIVSDTLRAQKGKKKLKTRDDMIEFMFPGWKLEADSDREATYRNNDLRASIVQKKGSGYAVPFALYLWDKGYVGGYAFLPAAVEAAKGARANPRRNGGPSPWADNAEYETWKRRHAAEQYARAATAAGKLSVTYGGEPTDSGSIAHGAESGHTHDMRSLGQRVRFGTALWRVADLPPSLYREAPTREGREAIAAYILAHRIPPLRSNGRRSR